MRKYATNGWTSPDIYNQLIYSFGEQFGNTSLKEMASFCECLGIAGLKQEDVFEKVVDTIEERCSQPDEYGK